MRSQNPPDRRAKDSNIADRLVGGFPQLASEPVASNSNMNTILRDISAMSDDVLEKATIELRATISAAQTRFALQVRELEHRDIPSVVHGLTTVGWLRHHCNIDGAEASGVTKTGRALTHMPTIVEQALGGNISYRSVSLLAQARDRNPSPFPHHEAVFSDVATRLTPHNLRRVISHWEQQVNHQQALGDIEHINRLRSLYLAQTFDGVGEIRGTLNPELFHTITTAIQAHTNPTWGDHDDHRSPTQKRADALGDICRFFLDHNTQLRTSGGEKPHITITIDHNTFTGARQQLAELGGAPVNLETIKQIACDAAITRIVLDAKSIPIDVGRKTRTIPPGLRRALEHRDQGCVWKGCTAPVSWCDAHHLTHWANGGPTTLQNTVLLCRKHHTRTHRLDLTTEDIRKLFRNTTPSANTDRAPP